MENPETGVDEFPKRHWGDARVQRIVSIKLAAVAVKQIARSMPEGEGRSLLGATDSATAEWDGDLCPVLPKWPFPGPRPNWAALIAAAQMSDLAATLPDGSTLREDIAASASELALQTARAMSSVGEIRSFDAPNGETKLTAGASYGT